MDDDTDDTIDIPPQPGPTSYGSYSLIRPISEGLISKTYAAERGGTRYALEVLTSPLEEHVRVFQQTSAVMQSLDHPHILPCLDVGEDETQHFRLTPLISQTLREKYSDGPPERDDIGGIIAPVADALTYMHHQGIFHGHIGPQHVVFSEGGHLWLTGLSDLAMAECLEVFGNPCLLAPEQLSGPIQKSVASDVYQLGELAFFLLTGVLPFQSLNGLELFQRKRDVPPSICGRVEHPVSDLDHVLQKAMAPHPQNRFESVAAFYRAFETALLRSQRKWWQFW